MDGSARRRRRPDQLSPGAIGRYVSGLCAAGLGLCAAGWLVLTPFAFGYGGGRAHDAALTDWATGGSLAVVCVVTLAAWAVAWRRTLCADGVLARPPRGPTRTRRRAERRGSAVDPDQVLTALRALLAPLVEPSPEPSPEPSAAHADEPAAVIPGPRSAAEDIATVESMLAGAELLMTGCDEEEAW
jgi:hypothetical protein